MSEEFLNGHSSEEAESKAALVRELLLGTDDGARWLLAVKALDAADAVPILATVLKNKGESLQTRRQAALILGVLADRSGIEPLVAALGDEDPVVRARALEALAQFEAPGPEAQLAVSRALRDEDDYVREVAAITAGALKVPGAQELLKELANADPASDVRAAAAESLRAREGSG